MSIENSPLIVYPEHNIDLDALQLGGDVFVRPLTPDEILGQRREVQQAAFLRQYVETGLLTRKMAESYTAILDEIPEGERNTPTDVRYTGVFVGDADEGTGTLMGFDRWGRSVYPYTQAGMRGLPRLGDDGKPAYTNVRTVLQPGLGIGSVLRHGAAITKSHAGFAVAGLKQTAANMAGREAQIAALDPVYIMRNTVGVNFPVPPIPGQEFAMRRIELYFGLHNVLHGLEGQMPALRKYSLQSA